MATRAGVGTSHHHSPTIAGHEAAEQALKNAGFHTYGEIGPVGKHNCYHNYTAVVLALS